ncbi:class I SAM-dependent methyltransferase [Nocardia terpenica]|uniref:class I SAM-dependent methyltransferase n=1 Tax=Nocardia terpenica TaxID=455432 RepID=UPI001EEA39F8|nr:class I SAM-dependent methyltransferase [Nocardia terpenica]
MDQGSIAYNNYDGFAREYARHNETSPYNALYERPAILHQAGDVRGLRVLDAGCGAGLHAAELIRRGAAVTGVDLSDGLLALARERLGDDVPLHRADLTDPLPFGDNTFDLVMAPLVLHYLEHWEPVLREFRRVLVPGGRVVLSTHHPTMDIRVNGTDDYLGTYSFTEDWTRGGRTVTMRFWHRPLRAMLAAFRAAGFTVDEIAEPDPQPELADIAPEDYRNLTRRAQFLFFTLTAR